MKYSGLILVTFRGLVFIAVTVLLLWYIREHLVYGEPHIPWGIFTVIAGGVLGGVFALSAKSCSAEINKLKK